MWADSLEPSQDREPAPGSRSRPAIRIIALYEASWRDAATDGGHFPPTERLPRTDKLAFTEKLPLTSHLRLGRLAAFYEEFAAQLPVVLINEPLDPKRVSFSRWRARPTSGRLWLLGLPSKQVVVGLECEVTGGLDEIGDVIEDCADGEFTVDGMGLAELTARKWGAGDQAWHFGERHQIVVAPARPADAETVIQNLVSRSDAGRQNGSARVSYPVQLNRLPGAVAAIASSTTVLCGQPEHVANAALAVAAQAVANVARLRQIRIAVYDELRQFWAVDRSSHSTRSRRSALESITHKLARFELDLAVAVEAPIDVGALIPSRLVREYQDRLESELDIPALISNATRMLRRLESTGRSELASVANIERRADENQRQRWSMGVGFISVVAVPVSLILAFFSAEVAHIESARSMFAPEYLWLYAVVGLLVLMAIGIGVGTYLVQRNQARQEDGRPTPAPRGVEEPPGRH